MALREELNDQGDWLFRWRSYVPLVVAPLVLLAATESESLEQGFGDLADDIVSFVCLATSFLGLVVRCLTIGYTPKGTSGRNTRNQKAETLNTSGIYSTVRHPLYLGNFLIYLGLLLATRTWWLVLVGVLLFVVYYERIIFREEEFLRAKFGAAFLEWADRTPVFWPSLKHRRRSELPFSLRNVLKREYSGFFAIVACFTVLELGADLLADGRLELEFDQFLFFATGLAVYLTLRFLKKKTKLLHVGGR